MEEEKDIIERMVEIFSNSDKLKVLGGDVLIFLVRLIVAAFLFLIMRKIIRVIMKKTEKINPKEINKSFYSFSRSVLKVSLNVISLMMCLMILGVKESAFIGLLGGAGLGIGLALKDTLANFAGGLILIVFKAYEIGDFIEVNGQSGTVHEINVFATILNTIDNKRILVPNGLVTSHQIINYTKNNLRRVDIMFGISYGTDFRKAIKILTEIAEKHEKVEQYLEKTIRLKELGDSSVNITFRVWCASFNYWEVYYDVMEAAKLRFDEEGIKIPFPQMDVHLHKENIEKETGEFFENRKKLKGSPEKVKY